MPKAYQADDGTRRKVCTKCREDKPVGEFGRHSSKPDGLDHQCRKCNRERSRRWRENNLERKREKDRCWHESNREGDRETTRCWRENNPERMRENRLWHRYGLTLDQLERMWERQHGQCRFTHCRRELQWGEKGGYAVDHDHDCCPGYKSCGQCVRGLVCKYCNSAIGYLQDNPDLMREIADYVEGDWRWDLAA